MHPNFEDRVVLITGGSSGIGLATARAFVQAGACVVIGSRNADTGKAAIATLECPAGQAVHVVCDVRDETTVARAVAHAVTQFGQLDFAFNCAGIGGDFQPIETTSQQVWDDVMSINARGVWIAMRHEISAMLASGGGAIVNMSSIYGAVGKVAHHAYVASKHAVIGMTRSVGLEHAARGVRINAICAGVTETAGMRYAAQVMPEMVQALVDAHPMKRMATEQDIANAVLWLCSPQAAFITATPLAVDGGFLAA